jgi:hypothetical protein
VRERGTAAGTQRGGAGWPVKTGIQKFRGEIEEFIRKGEKRKELAMAAAH